MGICKSVCSSCTDSKNTGGHSNNSHHPSHNQHGGGHSNNNNSHRGGGGSKCYTCNAHINQRPEVGRDDYRIQVNAQHHGDHTCNEQILTMVFNHPATFINCSNGSLHGPNNKSEIKVKLRYHNNPNDNIGMGDFTVKSNHKDLQIVRCFINDGH